MLRRIKFGCMWLEANRKMYERAQTRSNKQKWVTLRRKYEAKEEVCQECHRSRQQIYGGVWAPSRDTAPMRAASYRSA